MIDNHNESHNSISQEECTRQRDENSVECTNVGESQANRSVSGSHSQPDRSLLRDSLPALLKHFQEGVAADAGSNPLHPFSHFLF